MIKNNNFIHGHKANKSFGQNFLQDSKVIDDILYQIKNYAEKQDVVIEIGGGLGAISTGLIEHYQQNLFIIEIDNHLAQKLQTKYKDLVIFNQDVLKFNFEDFYTTHVASNNKKLHIVGNLPYNISSNLLLNLISCSDKIASQHFMLQDEVVNRMIAPHKTKDYGRLSIILQANYEMQKTIKVAPEAFFPVPKVNSAVVSMTPNKQLNAAQMKVLEYITRIFFSQRRKMLRGFIKGQEAEFFTDNGVDLSQRAEEISLEQYIFLAKNYTFSL